MLDQEAPTRPFVVGEEAVIAHLAFVSAEIKSCTIEYGGEVVTGAIRSPDYIEMTVDFVVNDSESTPVQPKVGQSVRVVYSLDDETHFAFNSTVSNIKDEGRWQFSVPTDVERSQKRLTRRHRVRGSFRWVFRVKQLGKYGGEKLLDVHDISASGLSFVYDMRRVTLKPGSSIAGVLTGPDKRQLMVRAVVKDVGAMPKRPGDGLARCEFKGFGFRNHVELAETLGRLDPKREKRTKKKRRR